MYVTWQLTVACCHGSTTQFPAQFPPVFPELSSHTNSATKGKLRKDLVWTELKETVINLSLQHRLTGLNLSPPTKQKSASTVLPTRQVWALCGKQISNVQSYIRCGILHSPHYSVYVLLLSHLLSQLPAWLTDMADTFTCYIGGDGQRHMSHQIFTKSI